jgi:biopolymer transport protein ExbD
MGLHLNENSGDDLVENHEINVTPFIDVMLVLLIIFMVAAPLATVDIKVDLPASTAKPVARPEKPLFLSVKADQSLFLGEDKVSREQLGQVLDAKTKGKKDTTIFFQADKGVDYGDLMEVMNALRGAGYLKVGLVGLETVDKK